MSTIDTEMVSIAKYLENTKGIRVPEYQRSYAWTEDEVVQLWQDILESKKLNRQEYFIGPIVVKNSSDGKVEIIDGQQRVATILTIISVIRQNLRSHGDAARADLFTETYFGKKDIVTLENNEKFFMNEENGSVFKEYISKEVGVDIILKELGNHRKKSSNHMLLNSYLIINDNLRELAGDSFDESKVIEFYAYLVSSVKILVLSVEDEADAYIIFETLNDRGRSLDTLDLLKNHLFAKSKDNIAQVRKNWALVKEYLLEADPKNRFMYHFWTSLHGRTPTANGLFRVIRDSVNTPDLAVSFSQNLVEGAKKYAALQNGGNQYWDDFPAGVSKNIQALVLLDAQQALPVLLAADRFFDKNEFSKLAKLLVVMAVRYTFIGEERTGVLANYYSEIPKMINDGKLKKASNVFSHLKMIYPNDKDFLEAFKIKSITDSKRARYILAEIENYNSQSEKIVNSDPESVNLEHILPKNTNQNWNEKATGISADEHKDYVNKIGNLALTNKSSNKKAGAKNFSDKKEKLFKDSEFTTTSSICDYEKWNKLNINKRQNYLAQIAVKVWDCEFK